jgi:hypothetical protein
VFLSLHGKFSRTGVKRMTAPHGILDVVSKTAKQGKPSRDTGAASAGEQAIGGFSQARPRIGSIHRLNRMPEPGQHVSDVGRLAHPHQHGGNAGSRRQRTNGAVGSRCRTVPTHRRPAPIMADNFFFQGDRIIGVDGRHGTQGTIEDFFVGCHPVGQVGIAFGMGK